jgi:hypothetical protein
MGVAKMVKREGDGYNPKRGLVYVFFKAIE